MTDYHYHVQVDTYPPRGFAPAFWEGFPRNGPEEYADIIAGPRKPSPVGTAIGSGLPLGIAPPNICIESKSRRAKAHLPPRVFDFTYCARLFLVTQRAKDLITRIDPDGFEFMEVGTHYSDGVPGPPLWLGDCIRLIPSEQYNPERRTFAKHGAVPIEGAMAFRYGSADLTCTEAFKQAWEGANLVGLSIVQSGELI